MHLIHILHILRMARNKHELPCLKLSTFPINYQSLNGPSSILINEMLSALAAHPDWPQILFVFFPLMVKKSPLTSQCQIRISSYSCFLCHVYKDLTSQVSPVSCKTNNLAQLSYFLCSLFSLSLHWIFFKHLPHSHFIFCFVSLFCALLLFNVYPSSLLSICLHTILHPSCFSCFYPSPLIKTDQLQSLL